MQFVGRLFYSLNVLKTQFLIGMVSTDVIDAIAGKSSTMLLLQFHECFFISFTTRLSIMCVLGY